MVVIMVVLSIPIIQNIKKEIFGREFTGKGICLHNPICLSNPDDKTLDVLKEVLLKRKESDDLEIKDDMNIYNYGMM